MVDGRMRLALALCAQLLVGCARPSAPAVPAPPGPVTTSGTVAYAHSAAEVRRAYRMALEGRGLRVELDSAGDLEAITGRAGSPEVIRVVIVPADTLMTHAITTYRYWRFDDDFYHWPFLLPQLARHYLVGLPTVVRVPQAIAPSSLRSCPPTSDDTTPRIQWPTLVGGAAALARRVQYTEDARTAEVQGIVYLVAVVNEAGHVACVEVLSGLPHGLTESAVRVLRTARFTPARLNGRSIAVRVVQPVWFRLLD